MKRILALLTSLALVCALAACAGNGTQNNPEQSQSIQAAESQSESESASVSQSSSPSSSAPDSQESASEEGSHVLVAYFSATGNTEGVAQHLQTVLDADLFEIVPETPYTSEDLDYGNDNCRANQEQNDPAARPAIAAALENPETYDVVFLGYPIWWGQAPKIIWTFLESYDFGDAVIVPFCTSGSSGIDGSLEDLQALAPDAQWMEGQRFGSGASQDEVAQWVESLRLVQLAGTAEAD